MVLPNFFCVGTQKAATTTLHDILRQHPDIFLPSTKEAWFFHRDEKYQKGLDWYSHEYFIGYDNEKAVGEITPEYMYFARVPGRIYESLGRGVKLLFILRNPVDRAYSHYLMTRGRGLENLSFEKAIEVEHERINSGFSERIHYSYIARGRYLEQIERYLKYFPQENMMFLIFEEDIIVNIEESINRILRFLEVSEISLDCSIKSNPATMHRTKFLQDLLYKPYPIIRVLKSLLPFPGIRSKVRRGMVKYNQKQYQAPKLDSMIKKRILKRYFIEDIRRLEQIIRRDLKAW